MPSKSDNNSQSSWVPEVSKDTALKGLVVAVVTAGAAYGVYRAHQWWNTFTWTELFQEKNEDEDSI